MVYAEGTSNSYDQLQIKAALEVNHTKAHSHA